MLVLLAVAVATRPLQKLDGAWRFGAESAGDTLAEVKFDGAPSSFAVTNGSSLTACAFVAERHIAVKAPCSKEDEKGSSRLLAARASWEDAVESVGWGYLVVKTSEDAAVSDDVKVYSAGLLEGLLTSKRVGQFRRNADAGMAGMEAEHHAVHNIFDLFHKEISFLRNETLLSDGAWEAEPKELFKKYTRSVFLQTWGLLDGVNGMSEVTGDSKMSLVELFLLNSDGETPELQMAEDVEEQLLRVSQHTPDGEAADSMSFVQTGEQRFLQPSVVRREVEARRVEAIKDLTPQGWADIKSHTGRCSALVRLAPENADLFVGHATFSDFSEMLRIFKVYDFPLAQSAAAGCTIEQGGKAVQECRTGKASRTMGFSSYPGVVTSTDDYYVLSSGLVITETTISLLTDEPYDKLDDSGHMLPDFIRVMAASWAADSGKQWVDLMKDSATGTYASQWMVVDYAKFEKGAAIPDGTLHVLEQVPGLSHGEDMSEHLRSTGFWASENRAYFPDVRDVSGFADAEMMHGKLFSADHNPRADIFHATAPNVSTLSDMRAEMRRNRWPHEVDGGPENSPDHAISARSDLLAPGRAQANGGVDAKVANSCLVSKLTCMAVSGPTADQKVFEWDDEKKDLWPGVYHEGLPNKFDFPWLRMTPTGYEKATAQEAC